MKSFYNFVNATASVNAKLVIYSEIGFWGVGARDFHAQLKAVGEKDLDVYINSPGGNVVEGYAIYNMLNRHAGTVTVYIDGIAGSIASVIAMAGKKIVMPKNTLLFVHMPLVNHAEGNAEELRKIAENLDKVTLGIISVYAAKTCKDEATIRKWMDEETLFTAEEALSAGLANEIVDKVEVQAKFSGSDYFQNKIILDLLPAPSAGPNNQTETKNMSKELLDQINALGTEKKDLADKLKNAGPEAVAAYKAENQKRLDAIRAHATKYNKGGDLDVVVAEAASSEMTIEQFKDKVTDIISNRTVTAALKPDKEGGNGGKDGKSLMDQYKATKVGSERSAFVAKHRKELLVLAKGGTLDEDETE